MAGIKNLVSVVLPVYNGERFLREALRSVFDQTYKNLEIIVIDDGSTDKTAEIAQSFGGLLYFHQSNQGVAATRNQGISHTKGEFVAMLDSDDLWTIDKLQLQVEYLQKNPDAGLVFAHEKFFFEENMEKPSWIKEDLWQESHPAYVPSTLLARKSVFENVGGFDSNFKRSPETDWLFRVKDAAIPIGIIPEVLLMRRIHDRNLSYASHDMMKERMKILRASVNRQREKRF